MNNKTTTKLVGTLFICLISILPNFAQKDPGLFLNDWKGKVLELEEGVITPQTGKAADSHVVIDANDTINKVSKYLFGGNLNPYSYLFKKYPEKINDLKNMSPNVLRWPGGNLSNDYFWHAKTSNDLPKDLPGTKYWLGSNPSTHDATTPDYYEDLRKTNSVGCICVNYSYARYGKSKESVQNAAHIAAQWVRHDKGKTKFWEIGNENYGNWQSGYEIDPSLYSDGRPRFISGKIYGEHCKVFIDSMRAAAAEVGTEIFIGVQAWEDYTSWDPIQTAWNDGVFSQVGNKADFIVIHNYFTPYKDNSTIPTIFGTPKNVKHMVEVISSMVKKYSLKPMPIALTEYNIQARQSGQLISFINGMHATMVIGESMQHGIGMAQRWSTVGYWGAPGEMGTFTFKGEPDVPEGNMRPEFYYYYYMQKCFGDVMVASMSSNINIVSYASTFSSGQCGVTLMNKSNQARTIKVELKNFKKGKKYHQYKLVGGTDNGVFSGNVFVNGYGSDYSKGGPSYMYEKIKPYSTTIDGDIVVEIPSYGTIFLVIDGEEKPVFKNAKIENGSASTIKINLSEPIEEPFSTNGFQVLVNGNEEISVVAATKSTQSPNDIILTINREILPSEAVTISYYKGELKTNDNRHLVFFEKKNVENLLTGAAPIIIKASTNDNNTIVATFSKQLDEKHLTDIEVYKQGKVAVKLELSSTKISSDSPTDVIFNFINAVSPTDQLTVKYQKATIKSTDGGLLMPFSIEAANLLNPVAPVLDSAILADNGKKLIMHYNQPMLGTNNEALNVKVTSNGKVVNIQSIGTSGNKLVIFFSGKIGVGEQVLLNYSGGNIKSEKGILAPPINNYVVNNIVVNVIVPQYFHDVKIQGQNSSYELDILNNKVNIFTDRTYQFINVPDTLLNAEFIRLPNGLKSTATNVLCSFKVNKNGRLFVAHDDRISKPAWLTSSFVKTSYTLNVDGMVSTLYYKDIEKNKTIELGANQIQGTETSGCNNYVVIFDHKPDQETNIEKEILNFGIKVFPNPASDGITIQSAPASNPIDGVRILKLDGKVLQEFRFNGSSEVYIPTSQYCRGIYFIEVICKNNKEVKKVIINSKNN